jgi:hypothetical protein
VINNHINERRQILGFLVDFFGKSVTSSHFLSCLCGPDLSNLAWLNGPCNPDHSNLARLNGRQLDLAEVAPAWFLLVD